MAFDVGTPYLIYEYLNTYCLSRYIYYCNIYYEILLPPYDDSSISIPILTSLLHNDFGIGSKEKGK